MGLTSKMFLLFYLSSPTFDIFCIVCYNLVMLSPIVNTKVYTPEQVAEMLQLSKNTIYELIGRGEIIAKKLGKVYRIPATSLSFVFTGLDYDLSLAEREDKKNLPLIQKELKKALKL